MAMDGISSHLVEVTCSFCRGQGTDPFGIMSWLSTCCVCGGSGLVRVPMVHRPCNFCHGTGAVKTLTCTVCGGSGFVAALPGPSLTCPECEGSGAATSSALACLTCRGLGVVPQALFKPEK